GFLREVRGEMVELETLEAIDADQFPRTVDDRDLAGRPGLPRLGTFARGIVKIQRALPLGLLALQDRQDILAIQRQRRLGGSSRQRGERREKVEDRQR